MEPINDGDDVLVTRLSDAIAPELVPCSAPLVQMFGGIRRSSLLMVTGPPKAGKSTESARVAVRLDVAPVYLCKEMDGWQTAHVFRLAGASPAYLRRVDHITSKSWSAALRRARGAELVIVDSMTRWARPADIPELLADLILLKKTGTIVLAIAHWAREGHASGTLGQEHDVDATIQVHRDRFEVECRWSSALGAFPREPWSAEQPTAPAPSPRPAAARKGTGDPWSVLGVSKGASVTEVKKAFRRLIGEYHPDKCAQLGAEIQKLAAVKTREITDAARALGAVEPT